MAIFVDTVSLSGWRVQEMFAYQLPDGIDLIFRNSIMSNFRCKASGIFADVDKNCKVFHICQSTPWFGWFTRMNQFSFACRNETIFNQLTLTCKKSNETMPCNLSPSYYHLNNRWAYLKHF